MRFKSDDESADEARVRAGAHNLLRWVHAATLAGAIVLAVATTQAADWQPIGLLGILLVLAVASDVLALEVRGLHLSGAFASIVLAMALLGPAPAMLVGISPVLLAAVRGRQPNWLVLSNISVYATFPLLGGLLLEALQPHTATDLEYAAIVMATFLITNLLNFLLIYAGRVIGDGWRWAAGFRDLFLPVLPAQLGIGMLTVGVLSAARQVGTEAIVVLAPVLVVFQWLLRTAIAAYERGEQVEERNRQLASLQFGLISTMLKTLSLRDHMTARHSAAVARFAKATAAAAGLSQRDQELVHTAGLLHDVGKFTFPDHTLTGTRLTEEDWELIRSHPQRGADIVGRVHGYAEVAEIVMCHHERIDGRGYPRHLSGDDIPELARILAVADCFDVMTARDSYRTPMPFEDAIAELRRVAGTQLDARFVEIFVGIVMGAEVELFQHADDEDLEAELQRQLPRGSAVRSR
jgi:putative nucleotidyltransferase with HDIG domain